MKVLLIISLLIIAAGNPLDKYKWKNRILLIFGEKVELIDKQLEELRPNEQGLAERHMLIFVMDEKRFSEKELQFIRDKYIPDDSSFSVVLIGKDGGVKHVIKNEIFTSKRLFAIIDGMPMRKNEMK